MDEESAYRAIVRAKKLELRRQSVRAVLMLIGALAVAGVLMFLIMRT